MGEWNAMRIEPPRDGSWIIVIMSDGSGADLLKWDGEEWINGGGDGDLLQPDNLWMHYCMWLQMPASFEAWADRQTRKLALKAAYPMTTA